jgi:hypothetical protein
MSDRDLDERFTAAILNFAAGKPFPERMRIIAAILTAFGNLEAAGDNPRAARILFDASSKIERLAAA